MPTTSPDNIYYADSSTSMSAEAISAAEATSVQNAFDAKINDTRQLQTFLWANAAARNAQTGMVEGDWGFTQSEQTAYRYVRSFWSPFYPSGITPIVPASVAGSGVSVDSRGIITFSSATSIIVNGCFGSIFREYRVHFDGSGSSANVNFNLRASGTNSITAYDITQNLAQNGSVTSTTLVNQTAASIFPFSNTFCQAQIELVNPAGVAFTRMTVNGGMHGNPAIQNTNNGLRTAYISHRVSAAYDGFEITLSAAQSGRVRVYAYS